MAPPQFLTVPYQLTGTGWSRRVGVPTLRVMPYTPEHRGRIVVTVENRLSSGFLYLDWGASPNGDLWTCQPEDDRGAFVLPGATNRLVPCLPMPELPSYSLWIGSWELDANRKWVPGRPLWVSAPDAICETDPGEWLSGDRRWRCTFHTPGHFPDAPIRLTVDPQDP